MKITLTELSKKHKNWLKIAYSICECRENSKDLVQEMYLKMNNNKTDIKNVNSFIYKVIKRIHLNDERKYFLDKKNRTNKIIFVDYKDYVK